MPQPAPEPALICQNVPAGGEDCPKLWSPQHTGTPSFLMPQVSKKPASSARLLKVPAGAVLCPSPLAPQQTTSPAVLTAQLCAPPEGTVVNVTAGAVVMLPQQASVPSPRSPHVWLSPLLTSRNVPDGGLDCP